MDKRPKVFNLMPILVGAALLMMVLTMFMPTGMQQSQNDLKYSQILELMEDGKVTEFYLDLNNSMVELTLKEGTLYPILHTLERDGAVKSYEKEAPTGRTRKYYHVTKKGLRLLDGKKEEWTEFSKTVNAILAGTAPALA